jgi:hypothetical protein
MTSTGGEAAPGMKKGGDNNSWANVNLSGQKNKRKFTWSIHLLQINGEYLKQ